MSLAAAFLACASFSQFSQAEDEISDEAREAFRLGKEAYSEENYEEAIEHLERAYRLSKVPALVFNLAQAHRLRGPDGCQEAVRLYQRYLEDDPNAPNRKEALERIAEMASCATQQQSSSVEGAAEAKEPQNEVQEVASTTPPPVSTRARRSSQILTLTGASLAVAGLGLFIGSGIRYGKLQENCPCLPEELQPWRTLSGLSYGLMGVGAASLIAGGAVYTLSLTPATADPGVGLRFRAQF